MTDTRQRIRTLEETKRNLQAQGRALIDRASAEHRDLTAEESRTFDQITENLDHAADQIHALVADGERAAAVEDSRAALGLGSHRPPR